MKSSNIVKVDTVWRPPEGRWRHPKLRGCCYCTGVEGKDGRRQLVELNSVWTFPGYAMVWPFRVFVAWGQRGLWCASEKDEGVRLHSTLLLAPLNTVQAWVTSKPNYQNVPSSRVCVCEGGAIVLQSRSKPAAITINLDWLENSEDRDGEGVRRGGGVGHSLQGWSHLLI